MKALISILILAAVFLGVWKVWEYWDRVNRERELSQAEAATQVDSSQLAGLPQQLERPLQEVTSQGPKALKKWLDYNRRQIQDPRLAGIELDYVLLVSRENPAEAKRVFAEVKKRVEPGSPLYKRVQGLAPTYE